MEKFTDPHGARRAARPRERRHRRDHPEAVPEVDQAHRLRPEPVRRVALPRPGRARHGPGREEAQPGLRPEPAALPGRLDPPRAQELRLRLLARARAVGAAAVRLQGDHRAVVRGHLLQQLLQERAAADRPARLPGRPPVRRRSRRTSATASPSTCRPRRCHPPPAGSMRFDIEPFRKECLLNGWDEIGLTLGARTPIRAYEERRKRASRGYSREVPMKIALLAGDGIGPEILRAGRSRPRGTALRRPEHRDRGGARWAARPTTPRATRSRLRRSTSRKSADAVLFGAVGGPKYDALPRDKRPEKAILGLRKECDFFANLRPATVFPELADASTLKPEVVSGLDIMIVRELTGDIYFGQPRGITGAKGSRVGFNTMHYTEAQIRRILHVGFKTARPARQAALLGRQDERAGDHAALARHRRGDRARVPGRRAHRTCSWTIARCSSCATRGSST